MKKIILAIAAMVVSVGIASAQDMAQATELYNNGATAISMENWTEALDYFQKALEMGKTIGDEAQELVANCKKAIPGVSLQIAKDLIKAEKYDEAAGKLEAAAKIAEEFENAEVAEEAKDLVPKMWMQKGLILNLNVQDLTRSCVFSNEDMAQAQGATSWFRNTVRQQRVTLSLTWMFGQYQQHKNRKVGDLDELNRLGGGGAGIKAGN